MRIIELEPGDTLIVRCPAGEWQPEMRRDFSGLSSFLEGVRLLVVPPQWELEAHRGAVEEP